MIFSLVLLFCYSAKSQIVINEIMFNPVGDEPEWIELYNYSNETFSDSLIISDIIKGYNIFLSNLPSKSYCVIVNDTILLRNFRSIPDSTLLVQTKIPSLNNDLDSLTLSLKTGEKIDSFYYKGTWSDKGYSLERISNTHPAINNETLLQSKDTTGATCGMINSNEIGIIPDLPLVDNFVAITPNPFSPNSYDKNICHLDVSTIEKFDRLSIDIYNMNGAKVINLADEQEMLTPGLYKFTWDGKNENGYIFQAGVYPVIINLQNSQSGKSLQFKKLIVIGL